MNRREPGYLIPEQRRLEHVWSVAVRNLLVPLEPAQSPANRLVAPDVFYTLTAGASRAGGR
jgi:hypothetical protein